MPPAPPANLPGNADASVLVHCTVTVQGAATDCALLTARPHPIMRDVVLTWLTDPATRFSPAIYAGAPIAAALQMRVAFSRRSDAASSLVEEWPSCFPEYPSQYFEQHRTGSVVYHFTIGPDGLPTEAGLDKVEGGEAFGDSVLRWLAHGCAHFRPDFRQGVPVATLLTSQRVGFTTAR